MTNDRRELLDTIGIINKTPARSDRDCESFLKNNKDILKQ